MADIELVIKMSQESYNDLKTGCTQRVSDGEMIEAIKNGTSLPKGHGRIIDESQVTGTFIWDNGYIECYAPTIIEADTEESEEQA